MQVQRVFCFSGQNFKVENKECFREKIFTIENKDIDHPIHNSEFKITCIFS